jgi:hypothetical protein
LYVSEKALAGKMRCQSVDTDNSTSQVEHTSRRISPDYAAENGQSCFGIVTASLAKESDQSRAGCHDIQLYAGLHLQAG